VIIESNEMVIVTASENTIKTKCFIYYDW
jgi:hypothetical protein